MPRFMPRNAKRQPKENTTIGTNFLMCAVRRKDNLVFNSVILTSIGKVPIPKTYIIAADCAAEVTVNDTESAIYTSPHGNNPFNTPEIAITLNPGLPTIYPNCFFTNSAHGMLSLIK